MASTTETGAGPKIEAGAPPKIEAQKVATPKAAFVESVAPKLGTDTRGGIKDVAGAEVSDTTGGRGEGVTTQPGEKLQGADDAFAHPDKQGEGAFSDVQGRDENPQVRAQEVGGFNGRTNEQLETAAKLGDNAAGAELDRRQQADQKTQPAGRRPGQPPPGRQTAPDAATGGQQDAGYNFGSIEQRLRDDPDSVSGEERKAYYDKVNTDARAAQKRGEISLDERDDTIRAAQDLVSPDGIVIERSAAQGTSVDQQARRDSETPPQRRSESDQVARDARINQLKAKRNQLEASGGRLSDAEATQLNDLLDQKIDAGLDRSTARSDEGGQSRTADQIPDRKARRALSERILADRNNGKLTDPEYLDLMDEVNDGRIPEAYQTPAEGAGTEAKGERRPEAQVQSEIDELTDRLAEKLVRGEMPTQAEADQMFKLNQEKMMVSGGLFEKDEAKRLVQEAFEKQGLSGRREQRSTRVQEMLKQIAVNKLKIEAIPSDPNLAELRKQRRQLQDELKSTGFWSEPTDENMQKYDRLAQIQQQIGSYRHLASRLRAENRNLMAEVRSKLGVTSGFRAIGENMVASGADVIVNLTWDLVESAQDHLPIANI